MHTFVVIDRRFYLVLLIQIPDNFFGSKQHLMLIQSSVTLFVLICLKTSMTNSMIVWRLLL